MANRLESTNSTVPKLQISPNAMWSFILGILSFPPFPFGFITGIPAIILGRKAVNQVKYEPKIFKGKGFAQAGLILGYFSVIFSIIIIALILTGYLRP